MTSFMNVPLDWLDIWSEPTQTKTRHFFTFQDAKAGKVTTETSKVTSVDNNKKEVEISEVTKVDNSQTVIGISKVTSLDNNNQTDIGISEVTKVDENQPENGISKVTSVDKNQTEIGISKVTSVDNSQTENGVSKVTSVDNNSPTEIGEKGVDGTTPSYTKTPFNNEEEKVLQNIPNSNPNVSFNFSFTRTLLFGGSNFEWAKFYPKRIIQIWGVNLC